MLEGVSKTMKRLRIYVDTSVYGGCFDEIFKRESMKLFDEIGRGKFILIVSSAIISELKRAPLEIQAVLEAVPNEFMEKVEVNHDVRALRDAYLDANIVTVKSIVDAEHIAAAAVFQADLIVSWNFKHIVHFEKIPKFQGINLSRGYAAIPIYSPKEVVSYE